MASKKAPSYLPIGFDRERSRRQGNRPKRRNILIVCEGEKTEPNYFEAFRKRLVGGEGDRIIVKGAASTPSTSLRPRRKSSMNGGGLTIPLSMTCGSSSIKTTSPTSILTKPFAPSRPKMPSLRPATPPIGIRRGAMKPSNCGICYTSRKCSAAPSGENNSAVSSPKSFTTTSGSPKAIAKTTLNSSPCSKRECLKRSCVPNAPFNRARTNRPTPAIPPRASSNWSNSLRPTYNPSS